jgi:saccharopine dehydrogenase (NAD+, L-lysine forming)
VPGISSVLVRALAEEVGGADRIETALLLSANDMSGPGSFEYLLQELTMGFDVYVDGTDRPARPFTAPRVVAYPAPAGPRRAYLFPFSDQVLYPRTLGARTVVTRLSVDPPRMSRLLSLLAGTGAVHLAARPRPRAVLGRLRRRHTAADTMALYALRVDVQHTGRAATATLSGYGQAYATATGAAALVRSLASGEITQPGAWMPEQVIEPGPFLDRLTLAGLRVEFAAPASTGTAAQPPSRSA